MLVQQSGIATWEGPQVAMDNQVVQRPLTIEFVPKVAHDSMYGLFNELVASQLGRILGLPIPVGLVIGQGQEARFSHVQVEGGPPKDLAEVARTESRILCGTAVFDAWICNHNRTINHVLLDKDTHRLLLVGHGSALLGNVGPQRLRQHEKHIDLNASFAQEVRDFTTFCDWYRRLVQIPEYMIMDTVRDAAHSRVSEADAVVTGRLLIARRSSLLTLFRSHKHLFPNRTPSLYSPLDLSDYPQDYVI